MDKKLMYWSPFRDMDKFFEESWNDLAFSPKVDVYEKGDEVVVEMPITRIKEEDVDISIEDNVLTVSGESREKEEEEKKNYYRKEVREGSFSRSVLLPKGIKEDEAKARYDGGILKITIPKKEETRPNKKKIEIEK